MSIRSIQGVGQGGSDQLRAAVTGLLPNLASGNKQMALKQMDGFDNLVKNLEGGVAKFKGQATPSRSQSPAAPKGNGKYSANNPFAAGAR